MAGAFFREGPKARQRRLARIRKRRADELETNPNSICECDHTRGLHMDKTFVMDHAGHCCGSQCKCRKFKERKSTPMHDGHLLASMVDSAFGSR